MSTKPRARSTATNPRAEATGRPSGCPPPPSISRRPAPLANLDASAPEFIRNMHVRPLPGHARGSGAPRRQVSRPACECESARTWRCSESGDRRVRVAPASDRGVALEDDRGHCDGLARGESRSCGGRPRDFRFKLVSLSVRISSSTSPAGEPSQSGQDDLAHAPARFGNGLRIEDISGWVGSEKHLHVAPRELGPRRQWRKTRRPALSRDAEGVLSHQGRSSHDLRRRVHLEDD